MVELPCQYPSNVKEGSRIRNAGTKRVIALGFFIPYIWKNVRIMIQMFRGIVILCMIGFCTAAKAQWRQVPVPSGTYVLKAAGNPTRTGALALWTQSRPISDSSLSIWFTPTRFYESDNGGVTWDLVDSTVFRIIDQPPLQFADSPHELLYVGQEMIRSVFVQERVDLFTYYFEYRRGGGPFHRRSYRQSFNLDTGTPWIFLADREMIYNLYLRLDEPEDSSTCALLKSLDGGATWEFVPDSISGTVRLPRATTLAYRLRYPSVMFLGTVKGLFRSGNEGLTWDRLTTNSPIDDMTIRLVHVHPREPSLLYLVGYQTGSGDSRDRVYRSTDNGFHWKEIYSDTLVSDIVTCEGEPSVALMNASSGLMLSTDRGDIWIDVHRNLPAQGLPYRVQWIHLDPENPNRAYAATVSQVYVNDQILDIDRLPAPAEQFFLEQYPNPYSLSRHSVMAVRYSLEEAIPVTLTVSDILGRIIWRKRVEGTRRGLNTFNIEPARFGALSPGVYVLTVHASDFQRAGKILVQR